MKRNLSITCANFASALAAGMVLLLGGCHPHVPLGLAAPTSSAVLLPNVKVPWDKPEFLYTNASSTSVEYSIKSDGTLVPPLSRYAVDTLPDVPAQFETSISALAVSPDHSSVYLQDSTHMADQIGRYHADRQGTLQREQFLAGGSQTCFPRSVTFAGSVVGGAGGKHFLYVMYDQYNASRLAANQYVLMAYRFGTNGNAERLPGPPVVTATYKTAAFVANPSLVPAYAVTSPSTHFLYVMRPQDHCLDVYRISSHGALALPRLASVALGFQAGKSVFLPGGQTLYVADADHACLAAYHIGVSGLPTRLPATVPGSDPVLDPRGRFLYAAAPGNHALLCCRVLADGTLQKTGVTPTLNLCFAPCVDATGRFVYAVSKNSHQYAPAISQFRILRNGALAPLQPAEVPAPACTTLVTAQATSR